MDGKLLFWDTEAESQKSESGYNLEEICKKPDISFSYLWGWDCGSKTGGNSSQMFHDLDEAEGERESRCEKAEKYKPKTEEEQKKEAQGERWYRRQNRWYAVFYPEIMDDMSESIDAGRNWNYRTAFRSRVTAEIVRRGIAEKTTDISRLTCIIKPIFHWCSFVKRSDAFRHVLQLFLLQKTEY